MIAESSLDTVGLRTFGGGSRVLNSADKIRVTKNFLNVKRGRTPVKLKFLKFLKKKSFFEALPQDLNLSIPQS